MMVLAVSAIFFPPLSNDLFKPCTDLTDEIYFKSSQTPGSTFLHI